MLRITTSVQNDTNSDYEVDSVYPFYTGDTNAADYLGYDVVLYAQDNKNETDTIPFYHRSYR